MKTLIVYATRHGASKKSSELIAKTLKEIDGREVIVKKAGIFIRYDLDSVDTCVVGSSIAAGMWKLAAKRALKMVALSGKPLAVFVSAAGTMSGKQPGSPPDALPVGTLEEREALAVSRYIDPVVAKLGVVPVAKAAFGGRMEMFGKLMFDNWDGDRVARWASNLAKAL